MYELPLLDFFSIPICILMMRLEAFMSSMLHLKVNPTMNY